MFQAPDGSAKEVATAKRYFRVERTREEKFMLRDRALIVLIDEAGWSVQDVADAFFMHRDSVYKATRSFRQMMRRMVLEIADRC